MRAAHCLLHLPLIFVLQSCSVFLAATGDSTDVDATKLSLGASRETVEAQLGPADSDVELRRGYETATYEYTVGNEPDLMRATGHLMMDLFTIWMWELQAYPQEQDRASPRTLKVVYDANDRVVALAGELPTDSIETIGWIVSSDPQGAIVELDGRFMGRTPLVCYLNLLNGGDDGTITVSPPDEEVPSLGILGGLFAKDGALLLDPDQALTVSHVLPNSPAERAGFRVGDEVETIDGERVTSMTQLQGYFSGLGWNRTCEIVVQRAGAPQSISCNTGSPRYAPLSAQARTVEKHRWSFLRTGLTHFDLGSPNQPSTRSATSVTQGTAFAISDDGYFLTNEHVVASAHTIILTDSEGIGHAARVVASDPANDLCVLKSETIKLPRIPLAPPGSISAGSPVYVIGFPLRAVLQSLQPVIGDGIVATLRGLGGDTRHIQVTAPINPGNSGGPLIDAHGNAIGVASHKLSDLYAVSRFDTIPQGVNFGIKDAIVRLLLESVPGLDAANGTTESEYDAEQIAEKWSGSVILVEAQR